MTINHDPDLRMKSYDGHWICFIGNEVGTLYKKNKEIIFILTDKDDGIKTYTREKKSMSEWACYLQKYLLVQHESCLIVNLLPHTWIPRLRKNIVHWETFRGGELLISHSGTCCGQSILVSNSDIDMSKCTLLLIVLLFVV